MLYIIIFIFLYVFILSIYDFFKERQYEKINNKILKNFNIDEEKKSILKINEEYITQNYKCKLCWKWIIIAKSWKFWKFYWCSNYPNCHYTKDFIYK